MTLLTCCVKGKCFFLFVLVYEKKRPSGGECDLLYKERRYLLDLNPWICGTMTHDVAQCFLVRYVFVSDLCSLGPD